MRNGQAYAGSAASHKGVTGAPAWAAKNLPFKDENRFHTRNGPRAASSADAHAACRRRSRTAECGGSQEDSGGGCSC